METLKSILTEIERICSEEIEVTHFYYPIPEIRNKAREGLSIIEKIKSDNGNNK